jgi:hypothetical protein
MIGVGDWDAVTKRLIFIYLLSSYSYIMILCFFDDKYEWPATLRILFM